MATVPTTDAAAACHSAAAGHAPVPAHCSRCDAVCCRLTVVVMPEDGIPGHLLEERDGLTVMARDEEGWCVALDGARMCCSIYDSRPMVCRRFVMDGPYCRSIRDDYASRRAIGIELVMY